jgi:hypothetical protein
MITRPMPEGLALALSLVALAFDFLPEILHDSYAFRMFP